MIYLKQSETWYYKNILQQFSVVLKESLESVFLFSNFPGIVNSLKLLSLGVRIIGHLFLLGQLNTLWLQKLLEMFNNQVIMHRSIYSIKFAIFVDNLVLPLWSHHIGPGGKLFQKPVCLSQHSSPSSARILRRHSWGVYHVPQVFHAINQNSVM